MIDFHSHFLPKMDDGCKYVGESIQILKHSFGTGIDTIVSTSHFYPENESIGEFISRRDEKTDWLISQLGPAGGVPKIITGAEVAYFSGISGEKDLKKLCIGSTKYLLLEMPYTEWTSFNYKELMSLILNRGITPILAHVERYLPHQDKSRIDELLSLGVVFQANSEAVIDPKQRKHILKLIKAGKIHLLGSDCHDLNNRPPNLNTACSIIEKELGFSFLRKIDQNGRKILNNEFI